jgi:hypothetical protein
MPFDVEGARKAGYTDAEIAGELAKATGFDYAAAKSAKYSDSEIIAELAKKAAPSMSDQIPGGGPAVKPAPAPSVGERIVGAGEAALSTATGATTGLAGGVLNFVGVLGEELARRKSGEYLSDEASKRINEAFGVGQRAYTYEPRTAAGQEALGTVADAAKALEPLAGLGSELSAIAQAGRVARAGAPATTTARAALEGTARDLAGATGAAAAQKTIDAAARISELPRSATTLPRRALEALRKQPEAPSPTPGTLGSAGAAATDMATQRRMAAESLGFTGDAALTRGQATRDAAQLKFEVETAKQADMGAPLRQRAIAQTEQVLRNFDDWVDQTGAEAPNIRAVGQAVDKALVDQMRADKGRVRAAYKAAEEAGEMESPVSLDNLVAHLNDSAPDAATAPLLNVARSRALQLGVAAEENGQLIAQPVPLKTAERFRQAIGRATDTEATNIRQATIMKGLVDEATDGMGGQLYREARATRARFAQNYENRAVISKLLNNKRGTADRQVAFEDVFDHSIMKGSLDDVRNVRRVLQRGGEEGQQAWRELQGQTVRWLRDEATKGVATDSAGNRVISPAGLNKAVRSLDHDGKLEFIFGKQGAQRLRDVNDLVQYIKTVPPEAAVNTSNTAATLLAAFGDVFISGATGTPAPIATGARLALKHIRDVRLRNRINEALDNIERKAPGKPRPAVRDPAKTVH